MLLALRVLQIFLILFHIILVLVFGLISLQKSSQSFLLALLIVNEIVNEGKTGFSEGF